jgi:hypothetical protein
VVQVAQPEIKLDFMGNLAIKKHALSACGVMLKVSSGVVLDGEFREPGVNVPA